MNNDNSTPAIIGMSYVVLSEEEVDTHSVSRMAYEAVEVGIEGLSPFTDPEVSPFTDVSPFSDPDPFTAVSPFSDPDPFARPLKGMEKFAILVHRYPDDPTGGWFIQHLELHPYGDETPWFNEITDSWDDYEATPKYRGAVEGWFPGDQLERRIEPFNRYPLPDELKEYVYNRVAPFEWAGDLRAGDPLVTSWIELLLLKPGVTEIPFLKTVGR